MKLIDANRLCEELIKSHRAHAETSKEEALLQRDLQIVSEQPEAVPERDKPKPPYIEYKGILGKPPVYQKWFCPYCDRQFSFVGESKRYHFCPWCGQAIDWSAEEKEKGSALV